MMSKKKTKGQEKETRFLPSKSRHILLREEEKVDFVDDDDDSQMVKSRWDLSSQKEKRNQWQTHLSTKKVMRRRIPLLSMSEVRQLFSCLCNTCLIQTILFSRSFAQINQWLPDVLTFVMIAKCVADTKRENKVWSGRRRFNWGRIYFWWFSCFFFKKTLSFSYTLSSFDENRTGITGKKNIIWQPEEGEGSLGNNKQLRELSLRPQSNGWTAG